MMAPLRHERPESQAGLRLPVGAALTVNESKLRGGWGAASLWQLWSESLQRERGECSGWPTLAQYCIALRPLVKIFLSTSEVLYVNQ